MRVLIWTAGGGDAGIGHLTRCQSLIPALLKRGAKVQVIAEAPVSLATFIEVEGAQVQLVPDRQAALSALKAAIPCDLLICDRPDLSVADSEAYYAAGAGRIALLASSRIGYFPCDLAIIDDPVLTESGPPKARRIEVGAHLHMVRPDVLALRPPAPYPLGGSHAKLLIALSGSDPGRLTEPLVEALHRLSSHSGLSLHLTALIGAGWEAQRRLNLLESVGESIEIIDQPKSLAGAMASADVVVTLGGRTTYEAFALGRPAFCLPWDTTADYVFALDAQKLALAVDPEPETAARAILAALDSPADINARAARAFNIVDAGAADRVAALCLEGLS
ncbi:SpsG [Glycocaulis alkaliphilus]|uniref:SpsG n=1 Tax=Glycocaulis alkaliphilus TaxID=1434191 RepID=A0A3T0EBM2_9PROT|nr:glycosyltransferase [Glycocaulis alkaliphilus]AZU04729.1 SpsG [Glycocaulis alkaliphilus]GGB68143.1 hypothetical protein GCM10007417_04980 [Glycocaulis alkaliphilus]